MGRFGNAAQARGAMPALDDVRGDCSMARPSRVRRVYSPEGKATDCKLVPAMGSEITCLEDPAVVSGTDRAVGFIGIPSR